MKQFDVNDLILEMSGAANKPTLYSDSLVHAYVQTAI